MPYLTPDEVEATLRVVFARSAPKSRIVIAISGARSGLRRDPPRGPALGRLGLDNPFANEPRRSTWTTKQMAALLSRHGLVVRRDDDLGTIAERIGVCGARQALRARRSRRDRGTLVEHAARAAGGAVGRRSGVARIDLDGDCRSCPTHRIPIAATVLRRGFLRRPVHRRARSRLQGGQEDSCARFHCSRRPCSVYVWSPAPPPAVACDHDDDDLRGGRGGRARRRSTIRTTTTTTITTTSTSISHTHAIEMQADIDAHVAQSRRRSSDRWPGSSSGSPSSSRSSRAKASVGSTARS